jgi:hypothetical protein
MFFLPSFLPSFLVLYESTVCLHSLTPHGTTLTIIPFPQSINQSIHTILPYYYYTYPTGTIPHVKSKGAAARKVLQKMLHLRRRESLKESSGGGERERSASAAYNSSNTSNTSSSSSGNFIRPPEVDTMIVLDREIDLVSPLLSPLTYEGLVDDLLGVRVLSYYCSSFFSCL